MSKQDLVKLEGKITDAKGGGTYSITLENGLIISGRLCGKMQRFKVRVIPGDKVTIGVSPYDPSHGLILYRHRV